MIFITLLLASLLQSQGGVPVGDVRVGKAYWEQGTTFCQACHGSRGQGGYGPDLAGRRLTFAQFKRHVRQPWGRMPRWREQQISDRTLANVYTYLSSLPRVVEPGPWAVRVPRGALLGQRSFIDTAGCGQCHGADMEATLRGSGEEDKKDFAWLAKRVYAHTDVFPAGRMGTYSRDQLPEAVLRLIWHEVWQPRSFEADAHSRGRQGR